MCGRRGRGGFRSVSREDNPWIRPCRRRYRRGFVMAALCMVLVLAAGQPVSGEERMAKGEGETASGAEEAERIEFFYENVCASCDGDADFFSLYEECLSDQEKERLRGKVATFNVFLDSCREHYNRRAGELGIPAETYLPVLIAGDRWVSGMEQMEELLHEAAADAGGAGGGTGSPSAKATDETAAGEAGDGTESPSAKASDRSGSASENPAAAALGEETGAAGGPGDSLSAERETAAQIRGMIAAAKEPVVLLFTTDACSDCEQVKEWLAGQQTDGRQVAEYNIIQTPCLEFLKCMFREYGVAEQDQKVPALFYGDSAATGADAITQTDADIIWQEQQTDRLLSHVDSAMRRLADGIAGTGSIGDGAGSGMQSLLTLAGAGLLAGFNPCAVSMLLMLISMVVTEKSSVWKTGVLYLCGKYVTYLAIGVTVYVSASMIDGQLLTGAREILGKILAVLFFAAGILYLIDAVRIYRQEYGRIRTQLPTGMRRWNHELIRRAGSYSGALKPLLIVGLGMAVSVGEFFCTGQIYMASITYLLKSRVSGVWPYFLVYVTAMSLPAIIVLAVLQKTRNTERVSEFMLRHMGAVKLCSALLFLGYALYLL